MSAVNVGPFRLIDPPDGQEQMVRDTVAAIDYPWSRLVGPVAIRWTDSNEFGGTGAFDASSREIRLSMQFTDWRDRVAFVLAHEIGHLVDSDALDDEQRQQLMRLFHDRPDWSAGPYGHDSAEMAHAELWFNGGTNYPAKVYECFADQFVAAFAPSIWEGHWPRFVHWTDDHEAVRRIVENAITPPRQQTDSTQPRTATMTRGKHIDNALDELKAWRIAHRGRGKVQTAVVLAAQTALRSIPRRPA